MSIFPTLSKCFLGVTLVAAAPSGHALSLTSILHLHPHLAAAAASGSEGSLRLHNPNFNFRDVRVADQVYTIRPHQDLLISAPAGTPVYAASKMFHNHANGAVLTQVELGSRTLAVD